PPTTDTLALSLHDALPISSQRSSAVVETLTGRSSASRTTSEQVASKLTPRTSSGLAPAALSAVRVAWATARQTSSDDCSACSGRSEEHTSELQSRSDLVCR